jgi:nucleoside-diphosphate-sugar epimerase
MDAGCLSSELQVCVGSHVVNEFLKKGYKVRATNYNISKASCLAEDQFKSYVATGHFQIVCIPDILAENAFVEVLKGVSAVIYVAAVVTKPNPNETISQNIQGTLNCLRQTAKQPSAVRFVMTSSYSAAFNTVSDLNVVLNATAWNEAAVAKAWEPPPYEMSRIGSGYKASKVEQGKALWKFVEEEKPPFVVNSVLPSWITGRPFNKVQNASSAILVRELYNGEERWLRDLGVCESLILCYFV